MAHGAQRNFFIKVKELFPERFLKSRVLDVGSLDVNGNNRHLFKDCEYIGIDIGPGRNVDIVCKGHEYKSDKLFDIVLSSNCFEHDMYYDLTIKNCIALTKPGGLFFYSCASEGCAEHGTRRSEPTSAPLLMGHGEWGDYYKNLTEKDMREVYNPDEIFSDYYFEYHKNPFDLYFWGIKK